MRRSFESYRPTSLHQECATNLPDHFDARVHWKECANIIGHISDQGNCGSCWAVASADVISDRLCIASRGANQTRISARDMMEHNFWAGCKGGHEIAAFDHFVQHGLVTERCKPYPSGPFWSYIVSTILKQIFWPKYLWLDRCTDPEIDYSGDQFHGESFHKLPNDQLEIQQEIYRNGPVTAGLFISRHIDINFQIYSCESEKFFSNHVVRIIGWGVAKKINGDKLAYWLVANSWGRDWEQDGTFKVARGNNHLSCNIEQEVHAVYLKL